MMEAMSNTTPLAIAVLAAELAPAAAFAFAGKRVAAAIGTLPATLRVLLPGLLALAYAPLAASRHFFRWDWLVLYAFLPIVIGWLLLRAAHADPEKRGDWRDAVVLLTLGLAVDLRWFDAAWPAGLEGLGKLLLVDAGLYGFLGVRRLDNVGFDFRLQWSDWKIGMRELAFFAPVVILLGLALAFIHPHREVPSVLGAALRWLGIFVFVAIPEELFFRGWVQNLLDRRLGRSGGLVLASILFGLSHFNKRNLPGQHFNWHYVLLASIAGIFYGRAWRERRRLPASTITHTFVDWMWSWWF
jgi:membrane protease YdiL (CAAX protease family)